MVPDARLPDNEPETNDKITAGEVRLAHVSVREYLISEHPRTSAAPLSYFHFNEKIAHVFVAKICLAYLLQFDQDNGIDLSTFRSYPFSLYAMQYWMKHARSDSAGDLDDLQRLIVTLLAPTNAVYLHWMWLYCMCLPWEKPGTPLYFAAEAGLERACQHLLRQGSDVNVTGGLYDTPLQAAVASGHDRIVRLLLENGADINAQRSYRDSALKAAASGGHNIYIFLIILFDRRRHAYGGRYTCSTYGKHGPFPSLPGTPGSLRPCAGDCTGDGSCPPAGPPPLEAFVTQRCRQGWVVAVSCW